MASARWRYAGRAPLRLRTAPRGDDARPEPARWLRHLLGWARATARHARAGAPPGTRCRSSASPTCCSSSSSSRSRPGGWSRAWCSRSGSACSGSSRSTRAAAAAARRRAVLAARRARALLGALLSGCRAGSSSACWPMDLPAPARARRQPAPAGRAARRAAALALTLLLMALTPAVCEEALFRGPILRGLRGAAARRPAAAILTGVLFGLYHGDVWRFLPTGAARRRAVGSWRWSGLDHAVDAGALREQRVPGAC